eukprot:CAMPEP_0197435644 /NCGR_PEP_ID=MMETSP1175-20131217/3211_1 /TAXON_ID=1003142 /ORGANISM="Triceratium dubium, Strain CCMP147" /LENGTH=302 /DNA_ID=CAMNT_0042964735 /DNA_START=48 /DNA_END=960 /DNA_ORIENTATION=-
MKVAASLVLLAGSAAAFSSSQANKASTSALSMAYENEVGAQKPLGFWDPLNFLLDQPQERFDRLRYVELKHGRIAQLAVLGHIVTTAGVRLPGDIAYGKPFADVKVGLAGLSDIPPAGIAQIVAFIGFLELFVMKDVKGNGEFPGDFRNGYIDFGWDDQTDEWKAQKRAVELNNGRAAQMGILGLMMHEVMTGEPYVVNALLDTRPASTSKRITRNSKIKPGGWVFYPWVAETILSVVSVVSVQKSTQNLQAKPADTATEMLGDHKGVFPLAVVTLKKRGLFDLLSWELGHRGHIAECTSKS